MDVIDNVVSTPTYTEEDHETWHKLCVRQMELVRDVACREFFEGFPKLALDFNRLPDRDVMAQRIHSFTGWTLADAQNAYLGPTEWFEHIAACRFPVTDYIRKPDELDFTPLPDLFHEYFGHLAFFTLPEFADIARRYGEVYLKARTEEQQLAIARLWWFTIEFGFVRENGELKVIGAGLLSSPGELLHALRPEVPKHPVDINRIAKTPSAAYSYHDEYFILDSLQHWRDVIDAYARQEGLA
ncbi:MAG TPA: amino acid hydroxylase [Herpetosiphonaceae bacterium]